MRWLMSVMVASVMALCAEVTPSDGAIYTITGQGTLHGSHAYMIYNTRNPFGDWDAWEITNNAIIDISEVTLFSNGVGDNGLPFTIFDPRQPSSEFAINTALSDDIGVEAFFSGPTGGAVRWKYTVLTLRFNSFDPGESLYFRLDGDGGIGSGNAAAGRMNLAVSFESGYSGTDTFELLGTDRPNASIASVSAVPAPSSLTCMLGLFAMAFVASWWRRRKSS